MKVITLSVDIGIQVPDDVEGEDIALNIPHEKIEVQLTDGTPVKDGKVIAHTTTGVVDEFSEEDVEKMQTEPWELGGLTGGDDGP